VGNAGRIIRLYVLNNGDHESCSACSRSRTMASRSFSWSDYLRFDRTRITSHRLHPVYRHPTGVCAGRPNHAGNASDCVDFCNYPHGTCRLRIWRVGRVLDSIPIEFFDAPKRLLIESALLGTVFGGVVPISALVWG
jgi:hypothetical protein